MPPVDTQKRKTNVVWNNSSVSPFALKRIRRFLSGASDESRGNAEGEKDLEEGRVETEQAAVTRDETYNARREMEANQMRSVDGIYSHVIEPFSAEDIRVLRRSIISELTISGEQHLTWLKKELQEISKTRPDVRSRRINPARKSGRKSPIGIKKFGDSQITETGIAVLGTGSSGAEYGGEGSCSGTPDFIGGEDPRILQFNNRVLNVNHETNQNVVGSIGFHKGNEISERSLPGFSFQKLLGDYVVRTSSLDTDRTSGFGDLRNGIDKSFCLTFQNDSMDSKDTVSQKARDDLLAFGTMNEAPTEITFGSHGPSSPTGLSYDCQSFEGPAMAFGQQSVDTETFDLRRDKIGQDASSPTAIETSISSTNSGHMNALNVSSEGPEFVGLHDTKPQSTICLDTTGDNTLPNPRDVSQYGLFQGTHCVDINSKAYDRAINQYNGSVCGTTSYEDASSVLDMPLQSSSAEMTFPTSIPNASNAHLNSYNLQLSIDVLNRPGLSCFSDLQNVLGLHTGGKSSPYSRRR